MNSSKIRFGLFLVLLCGSLQGCWTAGTQVPDPGQGVKREGGMDAQESVTLDEEIPEE